MNEPHAAAARSALCLTGPSARALRRAVAVAVSAAAGVLLVSVPALAHITTTPDSAAAGSAAVLTFHVPNEEAAADTTKVDIRIPTDHPIAQLLVKPVLGWTISVRTVTLPKPVVTDDGQFTQAVSEVIWSGGQIRPGQFQDFTVSADPLPQGVSELAFKAIQTYSNGNVVRWIDLPQAGQPAPDHPAPVLTLTTPTATARARTVAVTPSAPGSDGMARVLAIAGLVVSLLALVVARWGRSPGHT
jgi:periplasmic copper chaperone A